MHIVEELIAERAPKLIEAGYFPLVRPALYRMLAYDAAVFLADAIRPLTGRAAFELVARHLQVRAAVAGLRNVPTKGAAIVIANHPTGLADGLAVFEALRQRRPDLCFLANADALRVIPGAGDIIIPVEWRREKRSRSKSKATLLALRQAIEAERLIVIFPSGRLAYLGWRGLVEREWESSAFALATRYKVPIIPLRIRARNSPLYYAFSRLNTELRDITLFREMLNKKRHVFRLDFGEPIPSEALPDAADAASAFVRRAVMRL